MAWRSSPWARWLGWTVVFALVAGACGLAYEVSIGCESWPRGLPLVADACGLAYHALGPGILPAWSLAYLVPPLVAAFVIGVRFPFWRWAAGPPVVLVTLVTAEILWELGDEFGPQVPAQPPTPQASVPPVITMLVLGTGLVMLSALLAVTAYKGVMWGQRREDETAVRGGNRSDDESRSRRG